RPGDPRKAIRPGGAGGDPSAAQQGGRLGIRSTHDVEGESHGGGGREGSIVVEEMGPEESAAGRDLRDGGLRDRPLYRAGAAAVHELERGDLAHTRDRGGAPL